MDLNVKYISLIHHISNYKKCFPYIDARSVSRTHANFKVELFGTLILYAAGVLHTPLGTPFVSFLEKGGDFV